MVDDGDTERQFLAFLAGFACSREGFNGECPIVALAPADEEAGDTAEIIAAIKKNARVMADLRRLFRHGAEAELDRISRL